MGGLYVVGINMGLLGLVFLDPIGLDAFLDRSLPFVYPFVSDRLQVSEDSWS